jgi:hypothetical protein
MPEPTQTANQGEPGDTEAAKAASAATATEPTQTSEPTPEGGLEDKAGGDDKKAEGGLDSDDEGDKKAPEEGEKEPEAELWADGEYGKLNVPEDAKHYSITEGEVKSFIDFARENKISKELTQKILDFHVEKTKTNTAAETEAFKKQLAQEKVDWVKELKKEHGEKYTEKYDLAKKVFKSKHMPQSMRDLLVNNGFDYHPGVQMFLSNIGELIGEDHFVKGERKTTAGQETINRHSDMIEQPNLDKNGVKGSRPT